MKKIGWLALVLNSLIWAYGGTVITLNRFEKVYDYLPEANTTMGKLSDLFIIQLIFLLALIWFDFMIIFWFKLFKREK